MNIPMRNMGYQAREAKITKLGVYLVQCHRQFIDNIRDQVWKQHHKQFKTAFVPQDVTLPEMQNSWRGGILLVDSTEYGPTPYGHEGNMVIRAAHNLAHLYFLKDFTIPEEVKLVQEMSYLIDYAPESVRQEVAALYWADSMGMLMHWAVHNKFKGNQTEFLIDQLVALDI
jgi:hypothetical protein